MAEQSKFKEFAGNLPGIVGAGVGALSGVVDILRRSPSVRAWASAKRDEKRRLRELGKSGSDLRLGLRQWQANNPRPQGADPYNPTNLGVSNQVNPNAQANIEGNGQIAFGTKPPKKSGFNPLWLLVAVPFLFPKQFKKLTGNIKL